MERQSTALAHSLNERAIIRILIHLKIKILLNRRNGYKYRKEQFLRFPIRHQKFSKFHRFFWMFTIRRNPPDVSVNQGISIPGGRRLRPRRSPPLIVIGFSFSGQILENGTHPRGFLHIANLILRKYFPCRVPTHSNRIRLPRFCHLNHCRQSLYTSRIVIAHISVFVKDIPAVRPQPRNKGSASISALCKIAGKGINVIPGRGNFLQLVLKTSPIIRDIVLGQPNLRKGVLIIEQRECKRIPSQTVKGSFNRIGIQQALF